MREYIRVQKKNALQKTTNKFISQTLQIQTRSETMYIFHKRKHAIGLRIYTSSSFIRNFMRVYGCPVRPLYDLHHIKPLVAVSVKVFVFHQHVCFVVVVFFFNFKQKPN